MRRSLVQTAAPCPPSQVRPWCRLSQAWNVSVRGSAAAFITIGSFCQHVEVKPKKQSVVNEQCRVSMTTGKQLKGASQPYRAGKDISARLHACVSRGTTMLQHVCVLVIPAYFSEWS